MVRDVITKFSRHHPVVERAGKFENGSVGVRGWLGNVSFVLVCFGVFVCWLFGLSINRITRKSCE